MQIRDVDLKTLYKKETHLDKHRQDIVGKLKHKACQCGRTSGVIIIPGSPTYIYCPTCSGDAKRHAELQYKQIELMKGIKDANQGKVDIRDEEDLQVPDKYSR